MSAFVERIALRNHREQAVCGNKAVLIERGFVFGLGPVNVSLRVCLDGGVKKWEDGKYLVFPLICLVEEVEKWGGRKLFCLVEEKKRRMKNVIYIN